MIHKDHTQGIINRVGANHISKISVYLNQHMIFNKFNEPFSDSYISRVLHGKQPNKKVESGIWAYVKELKEEEERDLARKAKLLEPVNPKPAQQ